MSDDTRIAEIFILPSQGLVYEEKVNPEVTLSSMTTRHEMLIETDARVVVFCQENGFHGY